MDGHTVSALLKRTMYIAREHIDCVKNAFAVELVEVHVVKQFGGGC
jgi:hypothetical protein